MSPLRTLETKICFPLDVGLVDVLIGDLLLRLLCLVAGLLWAGPCLLLEEGSSLGSGGGWSCCWLPEALVLPMVLVRSREGRRELERKRKGRKGERKIDGGLSRGVFYGRGVEQRV